MKISECKAKSSFYVDKKEIKVFLLDGSFVSILTNGKRLAGKTISFIKNYENLRKRCKSARLSLKPLPKIRNLPPNQNLRFKLVAAAQEAAII